MSYLQKRKAILFSMKSLVFLSVLSLLLTCEPGDTSALQKAGLWNNAAPPPMDKLLAKDVLDEVNALRARGCKCPGSRYSPPAPALQWNEKLEQAAQAHADDMYRGRYFSHNSTDGTSFSDRMTRAGYDWYIAGENIAKGQPTARAVVDAWAGSKGHCENMMNPKFQDMGVGKTGPYWVQDFGARK